MERLIYVDILSYFLHELEPHYLTIHWLLRVIFISMVTFVSSLGGPPEESGFPTETQVPMRYSCPWWKTGTGCWVFESCAVNPQWHIISAAIGIINFVDKGTCINTVINWIWESFQEFDAHGRLVFLVGFFFHESGFWPRKPSQATAFHYLYRYSWWEMMGDKSLLCNRWSTN